MRAQAEGPRQPWRLAACGEGGGDTGYLLTPDGWNGPLTTLAFLSALVCLTQRSCVSGRTVEMAWDSDSLLLLHVAP